MSFVTVFVSPVLILNILSMENLYNCFVFTICLLLKILLLLFIVYHQLSKFPKPGVFLDLAFFIEPSPSTGPLALACLLAL